MPRPWCSFLFWHVSLLFYSAASFQREQKSQCGFTVACWVSRSPSFLSYIDQPVKEQKYHHMVLTTDWGTSVMKPKCSGTSAHKKLPGWSVFSPSIWRAVFEWQISSPISHYLLVGYPLSGEGAKFKEQPTVNNLPFCRSFSSSSIFLLVSAQCFWASCFPRGPCQLSYAVVEE